MSNAVRLIRIEKVFNFPTLRKFKVGLSCLRKFLPNENFPQPRSKKYHHLFVWCLKLRINEF